ncbi:MAG: Gfo/Idh/MocA family oxidoreductase [Bryobacterales bacterium]
MTWRSNRRTFLMGMAAAAGAAAAPSTVRTAFIGVGNRGGTLLGQTLEQEGVNITAICDIDPAKRDEALSRAAKFNPKSYTDWREVVALDNVDAIKIATPCYLHAEMAAAALKAGKYVYCEKPLGITPEQVASVLKASQGAKGFLQIGQQLRYFPTVRETMKALHEDQVVGKIFAVRAQRDSTAQARPGAPASSLVRGPEEVRRPDRRERRPQHRLLQLDHRRPPRERLRTRRTLSADTAASGQDDDGRL